MEEVEGFFEAGEISTSLDELIEEIIISCRVREEGIAGRRCKSECGEEGCQESREVWILQ